MNSTHKIHEFVTVIGDTQKSRKKSVVYKPALLIENASTFGIKLEEYRGCQLIIFTKASRTPNKPKSDRPPTVIRHTTHTAIPNSHSAALVQSHNAMEQHYLIISSGLNKDTNSISRLHS